MEVNNLSLQLSRMVIRDTGFNKPPFAQTTSDEENKSRSSDNFWDEWSPALGHTTSNGDNQSFEQDISTLSDKTGNTCQTFPENCRTNGIPVLCVSLPRTWNHIAVENSKTGNIDQDSTSSKSEATAIRVVTKDKLGACHEDPFAGPQGVNRASEKVKTHYFRPTLAKDEEQQVKPGDLVLLKNKKWINRKGDKILARRNGPYIVQKHIGVYKLVKKRQKVNIKDLKKYRLPSKATTGGEPRKVEKQTVKRKQQVSTLPSKKGMRKGNTHCPKPSINEMRVGDVSINPQDLTCLDQNNWLNDKKSEATAIRVVTKDKLGACHEDPFAGPQGVNRASEKVKTHYFRPTLAKDEEQQVKPGDLVLLKNKKWINRKGDKILARRNGPYIVQKHIGVYKLVKKRQKVNIKDLKKYRLPSKATTGGEPRKVEKQTVKRKQQVSTLPSKKGMRKGNTHCPKPSINEMRVGDVSINPQDLTCLDQNNWLNDKVIHAYLNLLQSEFNSSNERGCYVLSCFLESKWERGQYSSHPYDKIPLEELQYVLLPVCQQNHWFLLVANMTNKTVSVHDSVPSQTKNERFYRHWINFMAARRNRGQWSIGRNLSNRQVAARRNRSRWSVGRNLSNRQVAARRNRSQWSIGRNLSNRQADNDSCGVFVLMNAEAILQKSTPSIMRQYHVHSYRKYVQKRIAESSPYNKHPRPCDLPFCSMMKIQ